MRNVYVAVGALLLLLPSGSLRAQSTAGDSLGLEQAIAQAVAHHPTIQQAAERIRASDAQIGLAHVGALPDLSAGAGYSRIGPVAEITLPEMGSFKLYPENNLDFHLGFRQTLYDFSRTTTAVEYARAGRQVAVDSLELAKWSLAYQTASAFYAILILHENIAVLDEQLNALNQHLDVSQKRVATGSATKLDILTTQVRVASTQSARIDAANALTAQEIVFRQLLGLPPEQPVLVRGGFDTAPLTLRGDSLLRAALNQRPEYRAMTDAEAAASIQTRLAGLSDRPTVGLNLTTGFMNGYVPNLNRLKGNYVAALSVQVPIFDGYRSRHQQELADAGLASVRARRADLERRITTEVLQAMSGAQASQEKIDNAQVQVARATEAVNMAQSQYRAGVVTNLDLLDAQTSLSQARLAYLRAQYDYVTSMSALDRATGRKTWQ